MVAFLLPPKVHHCSSWTSSLSASEATRNANGSHPTSTHNSALFPPLSLSTAVHLRRRRSIPPTTPHVAWLSSSSSAAAAAAAYSSFFTGVSIFRDANGTDLSCLASRRSKKGQHDRGSGLVDVMDGGDEDGRANDEEWAGANEMVPLDGVGMGLGKKPRGFGEGKTYDVSLEEGLLKEMEQNRRKAQVTNDSTLMSSRNGAAVLSSQKKPRKETKVNEVMSNRVRVRVGNLPKKKNIHRDLKLAFDKFAGIINISPAVVGNHKTRDPICKGFAFVDFKSEDVAERFSRMYSNQSLKFGKVEKSITCHVLNPSSLFATSVEESSGDEAIHMVSNTDNPSLEHLPGKERSESEERFSSIDASVSSANVIDEMCSEVPSADFKSLDQTSVELADGYSIDSERMSSNHQSKLKRQKKKPKQQKGINHISLGSASRLKGKERIIFSEAFSKYGGKVSPDSAKENQ